MPCLVKMEHRSKSFPLGLVVKLEARQSTAWLSVEDLTGLSPFSALALKIAAGLLLALGQPAG
jgi:hypothetical protein